MNIFGIRIGKERKQSRDNEPSFVPVNNDDGDINVSTAYNGLVSHQYGEEQSVSENQLIRTYRDISNYPDIAFAVEEISNETIIIDDSKQPVSLDLENTNLSTSLKKAFSVELDNILKIMNFRQKGIDIFRRFYIDGRYTAHIVVNEDNLKEGIKDIRYIDALKIKKFKEIDLEIDKSNAYLFPKVNKEYYIYNPTGIDSNSSGNVGIDGGVIVSKDSIVSVNSGLYDNNRGIVLSYLDICIVPANNLKMLENSMIIYRLSRAPERRIFYIDIGNLPKGRAEAYMNQIQTKHNNKLVYNSSTGQIQDDKHLMAMSEDYWIPRRNGRGTEIDTLPPAQNLSEIDDITYIKGKLNKTLRLPQSRLDNEGAAMFGRAAEINRDEVRFSKLVSRLRGRFSLLFEDLLGKQLILKGIVTLDEWEDVKGDIRYDFLRDNLFTELFETDLLETRLELLSNMSDHIGTYFSKAQVDRDILRLTPEQIEQRDKEIEEEGPPSEEDDDF